MFNSKKKKAANDSFIKSEIDLIILDIIKTNQNIQIEIEENGYQDKWNLLGTHRTIIVNRLELLRSTSEELSDYIDNKIKETLTIKGTNND